MDNTVQERQDVINSNRMPESNYGQQITDTLKTVSKEEIETTQESQFVSVNKEIETGVNHNKTYIEIITEKDATGQPLSVLEVDLIISREKGQETRRLAMNFAGIENQEMIEKTVNIDKDSFEELKLFFSNLDWNS